MDSSKERMARIFIMPSFFSKNQPVEETDGWTNCKVNLVLDTVTEKVPSKTGYTISMVSYTNHLASTQ